MKTTWETVKDGTPHGVSVDDTEISCWSGSGSDASGTGVPHGNFLRGAFQDHVAWTFGCGVLSEVLAAIRSFHPADWRPRGEEDETARLQVLRAAIREGHVETVRALVADGLGVNPQGPYDLWPLWEACHAPSPRRVEVVKALLEGGADPNLTQQSADNVLLGVIDAFPEPNAELAPIAASLLDHGLKLEARDSIERTALIAASARGLPELVALLLERGADIHASTGGRHGETPLEAAMSGDSRMRGGRYREVIELLLRHGADPAAIPPDHPGLLQHAASQGYAALASALIETGADIDAADPHTHRTPLMDAAVEGQAEVVKELLDRGAGLEKRDYAGREPLALAAGEGQSAVVSLLLGRGAKIDARDRDGNTALLHAARGGRYERPNLGMIQALLARGASVKAANEQGVNAVMLAVDRGRADVVECLLSHGATVDAVDQNQRTALDRLFLGLLIAPDAKGALELAQALLAAGADPNRPEPTGCTPVAIAAIVGRADILQLLLDKRADANAPDHLSVTPLMQAVLYGHEDAAEWLLLQGADADARTRSGHAARDLTDVAAIARLLDGVGAPSTRAAGPICAFSECPICRQLSDREDADENRGEHLPSAFARLLKTSARYSASGSYRCPYCRGRYELEDSADNSEHYPVFRLTRVAPSA